MTKESLNEKRDELARICSANQEQYSCNGVLLWPRDERIYKAGFDACAELMQEENDKLRDAGKALVEALKDCIEYEDCVEFWVDDMQIQAICDEALQTHGKVFEGDK